MLPGGTAVTVDTMVQGVHFDDRLSPEDVGYKLVAISVSDLAAVGAMPGWALLSMSLPEANAAWNHRFAAGLSEALRRWQIDLIGGDTTRTPGPITLSLTLGGACIAAPLTRSGAQVGDQLWVTGVLGLAGVGWSDPNPSEVALRALRRPEPPLAFALDAVQQGLLRAGLDLSDGLARDLPRLCAASGVGARVERRLLPQHPDLVGLRADLALTGGEDYQLLFTASPAHAAALHALAARHGFPLHCIGEITEGAAPHLDGEPWPNPAFTHFASDAS